MAVLRLEVIACQAQGQHSVWLHTTVQLMHEVKFVLGLQIHASLVFVSCVMCGTLWLHRCSEFLVPDVYHCTHLPVSDVPGYRRSGKVYGHFSYAIITPFTWTK